MKKITSYQCSHGCGFYRITKKSVKNHEERCFFNCNSRSCVTCIYLFGFQESECMAGVEFTDGKLRTQCAKHMTKPDDPLEVLAILEKQGHIKIVRV